MGKIRNDLTGQQFGRLTVIGIDSKVNKSHEKYWLCRCSCGMEKSVSGTALKNGYTKSCGCLKRELLQNNRHSNLHLYQVWQDMKQRCMNPNNKYYYRYGNRGIRVCSEWLNDYDIFYIWAISNGYKQGLQIDRIDNDGDYSPSNCRWVTPKQNTNNRSISRQICFNGETHSFSEWSQITGIPITTIRYRYEAGKTPEEILRI